MSKLLKKDLLREDNSYHIATHDHNLNQISNPSGDKEFNFANKHLHFKWVAPASGAHEGAFEIEASGAFTGDLIHVHQHTGNVGADTYMIFVECEDDDASCLHLVHSGAIFDFGKDGLSLDAPLTLGSGRVITSANEDLVFTFGKVGIGYNDNNTNQAVFAHKDAMAVVSAALRQNNTGTITVLNTATGGNIYFQVNNVNKMVMNASALTMSIPIAMGTNAITSTAADTTFTFGRTQIDSRFANMMLISHRAMDGQDEYAFGQGPSGNTYVNAPTGKLIYFHINDVFKMSMSVVGLTLGVPIAMGANKITGCGDPDNDQDVTTKIYVDNIISPHFYEPSNDEIHPNNTERQKTSIEDIKIKEIICYIKGHVRLYWEHKNDGDATYGDTSVWLNGVRKSGYIENSDVYTSETYDINVLPNDLLQIYCSAFHGETPTIADTVWVRNMKIKYADFINNDP